MSSDAPSTIDFDGMKNHESIAMGGRIAGARSRRRPIKGVNS